MDDQTSDSVNQKYSHIIGWGADLDTANRPAYPKERTPPRLEGLHWETPPQQESSVEILHSTERPGSGITPVFGTSVPPRGLSGAIRRIAFKYSENDLRHWLMLLFADRVNMVEGIGSDLMHGHIPNFYSEMGLASEFKYNRASALRKVALAAFLIGLGAYLIVRNSD